MKNAAMNCVAQSGVDIVREAGTFDDRGNEVAIKVDRLFDVVGGVLDSDSSYFHVE